MKTKAKGYQVMIWISVIMCLVLIGYPIIIILLRSFSDDGFTFNNYIEVFTNPKNLIALKNSIFLSVTATLASTIIGCLIAWLVSRTK